MIWFGVALGTVGLAFLARLFFSGVRAADRPSFVMDVPPGPLSRDPVVGQIKRWRHEGRLTREEEERLMTLLREDGALPTNP